jgi:hypothetical protein
LTILVSVTAGLWAVFELLRSLPGRASFAGYALAAAIAALGLLAVASLAYLDRIDRPVLSLVTSPAVWLLISRAYLGGTGILFLTAALGLPALLSRQRPARVTARRGIVLALVAVAFMLGPGWEVGGTVAPLPFAAVMRLGFFRYPFRFAVLLGFAAALLAAAGLQSLATLRGRLDLPAAALITAVLLLTRGRELGGDSIDDIGGPSVDFRAEAGQLAAHESNGPLLELPVVEPWADKSSGTQADAMVASTRHWLPLVGGFTGQTPPHWPLVAAAINRLPATTALDDLIDLTHVRWILTCRRKSGRPIDVSEGLAALPGVTTVLARDGCRLVRVDRVPHHSTWFEAIARGPQRGMSLLGTPLAPIAEGDAKAIVMAAWPLPTELTGRVRVGLRVLNLGRAAWPVAVAPGAPETYTVYLLARWWRAGEPRDHEHVVLSQRLDFQHDVDMGRWVTVETWLMPPEAPGRYALEIAVRQAEGTGFIGPGCRPIEQDILVKPASDARDSSAPAIPPTSDPRTVADPVGRGGGSESPRETGHAATERRSSMPEFSELSQRSGP